MLTGALVPLSTSWPSSVLVPTVPCLFLLGHQTCTQHSRWGLCESRVEGQNPLPRPAGHTPSDAAQDSTGFLGCKHTLPAHVEFFTNHHPQVLQGFFLSLLCSGCRCAWDCPNPGIDRALAVLNWFRLQVSCMCEVGQGCLLPDLLLQLCKLLSTLYSLFFPMSVLPPFPSLSLSLSAFQ